MNQKISILFLYIFTLFVSFSYTLDTGIKKSDIQFDVDVEYGFLEKKEKIDISWDDVKNVEDLKINSNTTYKIELLTNHALRRKDDTLIWQQKELINTTRVFTSYKWKIPKLKKRNYYGILITVQGPTNNIYGLSRRLGYIANVSKLLSSNSTSDVAEFVNKTHNKVVFFYEDEVEKIEIEDDEPDDETAKVQSQQDNSINSNTGGSSYVLIIIIGLIIIAIILSLVAFSFYRKNKKTKENVREILVAQKEKEALQNFDIKSESAESEIVREKLKQEALEKERQKVYESMKEKNLLMVEGNSAFPSSISDAVSNAVSNTNTDFSWHGMEVMSFNSPTKTKGLSSLGMTPITPLTAPKKIDYDAIAIEVEDKIQHQEEEEEEELVEGQDSNEININIQPPEKSEEEETIIVSNPNCIVKFKL